tara:strand:+ start:24 stop:1058 length:1035 start_codon:yes stop_codon:yes gene_type:complete
MNQKSLSAKNKADQKSLVYLKDKKVLTVFKKFQKSLLVKEKFAVAVSGGPDSLSLAFLAKNFSIIHNLKFKCFIVDHKLRKESSSEAKIVLDVLKKIGINCKILKWNGKKPSSNIQSIARNKRYSLLVKECKKYKIKNLLLGHHQDDLFENFLIRMLRGSGLNGLISLSNLTKDKNENFNFLRPLLTIEKKDLLYVSKKVFNFFIKDPSNQNTNFKRIRIRNLLNKLEKEGLDKKKMLLTINNLKDSNNSIKFYVNRNIKKNSTYLKKKNLFILNDEFFNQSHEVIFRSLTNVIQMIGNNYYPARGKSISELVRKIEINSLQKTTLGGCFIEKVNTTILISSEN